MSMSVSTVSTLLPSENMSVIETWCHTQVRDIKLSFTWEISNFLSSGEKTGEYLESSTFPKENSRSKWYMKLYPRGETAEAKDYLSLSLYLSTHGKEVKAKFKFSILNAEREENNIMDEDDINVFGPSQSGWGYDKFLERKSLFPKTNTLLPNGKLTLYCEVTVLNDSVNISGQSNYTKFTYSECLLSDGGLSEDLGELFEMQIFSDVILSVSGREFKAHKAILAVRSEVFAAMFEHNMKEKKLGHVDIEDVDQEVVIEMLKYIYSGRTTNLDKMAGELLVAADKYAIKKLKILCEKSLSTNLNIENVMEVLILADLHASEKLKSDAFNYFRMNATNIMETQGWKLKINSHPHLIKEACEQLAAQQIPPNGPPPKKDEAFTLA